jgi:hypothetical protein
MNPIQRSSESPRGGNDSVESGRPSRSPKDDSYKKVERDNRSGKDRKDEVEEEGGEDSSALSPFELARKASSTRRDPDSQSGSEDGGESAKSEMGLQFKRTKDSGAGLKGKETAFASAKTPSSETRSIAENQKEMMAPVGQDDDPAASEAMEELSATFTKGKTGAKPLPPAEKPVKEKPLDTQEIETLASEELPKPQEPKLRRPSEESPIADKEARGLGGGDKVERTKTSKQEQGKDQESGGSKQNAPVQGNIQPQLAPAGADQPLVKESAQAKPLQEIITQIVDRITVMQKGDLTETTITLKNPPILSGATITLSTLDQAKGEFNITFASLSPEGKLFLDRQMSENSLSEALKGKNIVVHQVITTTQAQNVIQAEQGQPSREEQQQKEQQQQQQQQEQEKKEEE